MPPGRDTIAQELFVFTLGGEGRHELERVVASDYSRAQIYVKLESMSSDLVLEQVEQAERLAKAAFAGTGISALTTGSGRLFSTLDHYLVDVAGEQLRARRSSPSSPSSSWSSDRRGSAC